MRRSARADERGSATVFVIGLAIMLFVCAGLVVDGGLAINARMAAADDAEQAARIAADSLDVEILRDSGDITINPTLAGNRARGYLADRGYGSSQYRVEVDPGGGAVRVLVSDQTETLILGIVGIRTYDVEAAATSEPDTGP